MFGISTVELLGIAAAVCIVLLPVSIVVTAVVCRSEAPAVRTPDERIVADLVQLVRDLDLQGDRLDELVHDTASLLASDANNADVEAQVRFLIEHLGPAGAQAAIL